MLPPIFVIGSEQYEPERISYLKEYFNKEHISNVTFFQPTYKHTLTKEEIQKYVPYNWTQYGRQLRMGEISLFLNFLYLFEHIVNTYEDGVFLIFESDVLFVDNVQEYVRDLLIQLNDVKYDCVSLGCGTNRYVRREGGSKEGKEGKDRTFTFLRKYDTQCTDSFLFTYKGILSFYTFVQEFLEKGNSLNHPIDNFIDMFLKCTPDYMFYWVVPELNEQGSHTGVYSTNHRDDAQIYERPQKPQSNVVTVHRFSE